MTSSGPASTLDRYQEALASVLELAEVEADCARATRAVSCLVKPAFHPECAISVVERGRDTEMTVRAAARSIWAFTQRSGDPVTSWVKPAVSVEKIAMPAGLAASWRAAVDELENAPRPEPEQILGLDGMSVDVVLWRARTARRCSIWFGRFDEMQALHRLMRFVLTEGATVAAWEQSTRSLQQALGYLP